MVIHKPIALLRESIAEWMDGWSTKTWGLIPMAITWLLFWWVPDVPEDKHE